MLRGNEVSTGPLGDSFERIEGEIAVGPVIGAQPVTVVLTVLELADDVSPPPTTLAKLERPVQTLSFALVTTIVMTEPSAPAAIAALEVQLMVVVPVHVQPAPVAETRVTPAGSESETVTTPLVAAPPPLWTAKR